MSGIRIATVITVCVSMLLLVLLFAGDEPCEAVDGTGLSAECRVRYETEANAGDFALMYRLAMYEASHGDIAKSKALTRKAAFGGFERAQIVAIATCSDGGMFSREEASGFAKKLKKSNGRSALIAVIEYYLDKDCGKPDLKSVWEVVDTGRLSANDACYIGVEIFTNAQTEMTSSDRERGRRVLKSCMDHATERKIQFEMASEMYKKTEPD